jgi:uncharacterized protein
MARILTALVAGTIFGVGLAVSQMVDPAKVVAFLDLAGNWDPSLAFVMGGAVAVSAVGFRIVLGRGQPLLEPSFSLPISRSVDPRLILGAALFGIGWGISGFCPGPAVASLAFGLPESVLFLAAMVGGMFLQARVPGRASRPVTSVPVTTDG